MSERRDPNPTEPEESGPPNDPEVDYSYISRDELLASLPENIALFKIMGDQIVREAGAENLLPQEIAQDARFNTIIGSLHLHPTELLDAFRRAITIVRDYRSAEGSAQGNARYNGAQTASPANLIERYTMPNQKGVRINVVKYGAQTARVKNLGFDDESQLAYKELTFQTQTVQGVFLQEPISVNDEVLGQVTMLGVQKEFGYPIYEIDHEIYTACLTYDGHAQVVTEIPDKWSVGTEKKIREMKNEETFVRYVESLGREIFDAIWEDHKIPLQTAYALAALATKRIH